MAQQQFCRRERLRTIRRQPIKGAGGGKAFKLTLVQKLYIDALGKFEQVLERAVGLSLGDYLGGRLRADALYCRKRVTNRGAVSRILHHEADIRTVDVGR